jgi:hypothetical protein
MSESPTVTLRVIRLSVPGQPDGWLLPIDADQISEDQRTVWIAADDPTVVCGASEPARNDVAVSRDDLALLVAGVLRAADQEELNAAVRRLQAAVSRG